MPRNRHYPITQRNRHADNKPEGYEDWYNVTELAEFCDVTPGWIRKLCRRAEKEDPAAFPIAKRVKVGMLQYRVFSPLQAEEAKAIIKAMKPGRRSK